MKKRMIAAMMTAMTALSVFGVTAMADDDELVLFTWEKYVPAGSAGRLYRRDWY